MPTKSLIAAAALAGLTVTAAAQEHRELGAHVHGVSTLDVALEDGTLTLDLHAPGMDIVGFEHAASSAADKDAVASAIGQFTRPGELFLLDDAAHCRLAEVVAHLHTGEHDDDHDHAGEEHHDHAAEDHAEDHEAHAEDAPAQGEDAHASREHGGHSEFHARYAFACDAPDHLAAVGLLFFDVFANAQEVEATVVTDAGAAKAEVRRDDPTLPLR